MMAGTTADEFEFECPQCSEQFEVNDGMREALLERGCPVCTSAVTETAFSSLSSR
ncbi:zinc ribbon domain-containing protein [Haloferax sp. MBLA0076]|uniref:Zinc ribbon domain-containing protein n=1 Tax=Haloferax litoreum TaxID=2666140 RepID=A0A6A8GCM3_9EURY|nr:MULTISPECIES: zinc ribbon domain-containing protein [Haloferax]KAB1192456.1 zinc ribbon domain-containing protein [Haloferax sp. CBA1148]MRX20923.1 zinc ribbon domain-containing protein [Haloferax litoreum]